MVMTGKKLITYSFQNDRLSSVQMLIDAGTNDNANLIKDYYEKYDKNSFDKITVDGSAVAFLYNLDIFNEFKNYTQEELKQYFLDKLASSGENI